MTIENSTASATQWGISSASVVLEALTEAGMATELCLVYPALAATPKVGPVAAGQDIYWRLLVGQQPLPVQRGGGQFDQNYLDYYSIRAVDALEAGRTAFDCDSEWSNAPLWYTSGSAVSKVLDALSISASILRSDFNTASSVMFLLNLGSLLEEWTRKKSLDDLARSMALNVDKVWVRSQGTEVLVPLTKVRSGDVRVLLGSTAKMGAGTNVQQRLVAVHHLDVGWKPSDMTQRNGRIIRQGNMNKEVKVFNYVTEGTFDSYLFQTLENKQRFISQIMTSKSPVRSCEDVDEQALSYAEIKALCAGNPLIKEKMDLDVQVAKLKVLKADHQSQKFRLEDKLLTKFPADIRETNAYIAGVKADAQLAAAHPQVQEGFCGMTIKGVTYDEKKTAGERLVLACSELPNAEEKVIGSYRGFELSLRFDTYRSEYQAILKGQRRYPVALGTDPLGNIIRLDNSLNNFPERINSAENELATLHQQQAAAQIEVEKPFPQEEELAEKSARLAELNAQLDVDEKSHGPEQDEEEQEDLPRRPSVLAALEEKSDKPEPVRPFRSYYDKDGDAR